MSTLCCSIDADSLDEVIMWLCERVGSYINFCLSRCVLGTSIECSSGIYNGSNLNIFACQMVVFRQEYLRYRTLNLQTWK